MQVQGKSLQPSDAVVRDRVLSLWNAMKFRHGGCVCALTQIKIRHDVAGTIFIERW
jgi:hypothetical protein